MSSDINLKSYPSFFKLIHWLMALLIFGMLALGFYMSGLSEQTPATFKLYGLHKSFGTIVLALVVVRILYRVAMRPKMGLPSHAAWEKWLSHLVLVVLYVAMFVMPLSGWLMSNAADFPYIFFGAFEMPILIGKDEALFKLFQNVHEIAAFTLLGALALHMAGAFKHHIIDRDITLKRMVSMRLGLVGGLMLALLAGGLWALPVGVWYAMAKDHDHNAHEPAHVEEIAEEVTVSAHEHDRPPISIMAVDAWQVLLDESIVNFTATQYGTDFSGSFKVSAADIAFEANNLAQSKVDVVIDIGSISTGASDRDAQSLGAEWFNLVEFPHARFVSKSFERLDGTENRFTVTGDLSLKNITREVGFPFYLEFSKDDRGLDIVHMVGTLTLDRSDFLVGVGQWKSEEVIGMVVKINIDLKAVKTDRM